ncbi:MAG: SusC/RagA family TonB-linked outer membrane protein [Bacteroidota bacterium]
MRKIALMLFSIAFAGLQVINAQPRRISGSVTNSEDNTPIPGVSVVVKGTTLGTITDTDGEYVLTVPGEARTLIFSFVGMQVMEVPIQQTTVDVVMEPDVIGVDEVMVVAYGTATKESFTGSASKVEGEKLAGKNTSEITKALAGEVAGVQVINSSGQPGTTASLRIRGFGSVNASREPLYIVDGIPFNGNLASIDPADIESTTVLKDASATAIYGARGANGVVVIATKKGEKNKQVIDVDLNYGINLRLIPLYNVIDSPEEYVQLTWEGLKNKYVSQHVENPGQVAAEDVFSVGNGLSPYYNMWNADDNQLIDPATGQFTTSERKYTPENWADEIFSTAKRREASVRLSGGGENGSYYTSVGYLNDEGYYEGSEFDRFNTRANIDQELREWLSANLNLSYSYMERNSPGQREVANNGFFFVNEMPPVYPVYVRDENGNKVEDPKVGGYLYDYGFDRGTGTRGFGANINPVGAARLDRDFYINHNFSGNAAVEAHFLNNFRFNTNFGMQYYGQNNSRLTNPFYGDAEGLGRILKRQDNRFSYTWNQILTYRNAFDKHSIEAFIAHENTLYRNAFMEGQKSNIARPYNIEWTNAVIMDWMDSEVVDYALESFFGQAKYNFDGKYYLYATARRDGTSRFPDNKWGTFGSLGAAWMLNKESFLADTHWINLLKLKASVGKLGNQDIGNYPTFDQYSISNLNDELSFSFDYKGNPGLTWESSNSFNTGIEFGLANVISGQFEYFTKKTTNLLFYKQVAPSLGFSQVPVNDGELLNTGFEFELIGHLINTGNVTLDLRVNGGNYRNRITQMPIDDSTGEEKVLEVQGAYAYSEGHSIYDFYVREFAGVNPDNGLSLWKRYYNEVGGEREYIVDMVTYRNENSVTQLGVETTADYNKATKKYIDKSVVPDLTGGFGLDFSWSGFEFTSQFAYSIGGHSYDNIYASLMGNHLPGKSNWSKDILNRWQQPGDETDVPRLSSDFDKNVNAISSRFIVSNAYLNLTNVRLSYTLPSSVTKTLGINLASVWVSGDNLFMLTARRGFIPVGAESGSSRTTRYAPLSTIASGIKLQF